MRRSKSRPFPIFRSVLQGELLAAVLLDGQERTISDLARRLAAPVATVQREVACLEASGILVSRRVGQARLVTGNPSSPIVEPLTELVLRTFGPTVVLARELGGIAGVEQIEIFGSWAARYHGEAGQPPGDIDVVVVGDPDRDELFDAAQRAEHRLGREVNPLIVPRPRWDSGTEPFLRGIKERPRVVVVARTDEGKPA